MKTIYLISLLLLVSNVSGVQDDEEQDASLEVIKLSAKGTAKFKVNLFNEVSWYPEHNDILEITDLRIRGDSNYQHFEIRCKATCVPGTIHTIILVENQNSWQEGPPLTLAYMVEIRE